MKDMQKYVTELIARFGDDLKAEEISPDSDLMEDIGLSSLAFLKVIGELEAEYGVTFTQRDYGKIGTPADLVRVTESKLN